MAEIPAFHNGLTVDSSPHVKAPDTTAEIMKTVSVALLPCLFAAVFYFGAYALIVVAISVLSAVLAETAFQIVRRRPVSVSDGSAVVTGLILGLNLPPSVPLYIPVIGSVFAIVLVKMLFGGLGRNFANPAATARIFLMLAYTEVMTRFIAPNGQFQNFWQGFDGMTSATPLGGAGATLSDLFLGRIAGSMGETCKIAVLIGFVFLLQKKVISWHIPVCYVLSFAFFTSLTGENFAGIATSVCSGGLLFGAVFMATDYATSPKTDTGKMLYALSLGALTFFIRRFTAYNEGVVFSILIMNLVVPLIDQAVLPPRFGSGKKPVLSYSLYAVTAAMAIALFILGLAKEGL